MLEHRALAGAREQPLAAADVSCPSPRLCLPALQYDNPTRPIHMYINSTGVVVSLLPDSSLRSEGPPEGREGARSVLSSNSGPSRRRRVALLALRRGWPRRLSCVAARRPCHAAWR